MRSSSQKSQDSSGLTSPPLSSYPRKGHRLAPATLHDVLDVLAPKSLTGETNIRLCELDESAWDSFSSDVCHSLAKVIVKRVHVALNGRYAHALQRRLPPLPSDRGITDLPLEVRTYNCLVGFGGLDLSDDNLEKYTIGDMLSLRGFGAKSLVDLLTSIESIRVYSGNSAQYEPSSAEAETNTLEIEPQLLNELKEKAEQLGRVQYAEILLSTDVRLGNQILKIDPEALNLRDLSAQLVKKKPLSSSEVREKIEAIEDLQQDLSNITELSLEEELQDIILATGSRKYGPRNANIYMSYYGWDGKGGATLEEVGNRFDLTRERARQICKRQNRRFQARGRFCFTPMLDKALSLVSERMPCLATEIETEMLEQGITSHRFQVSGLLEAAITLRKDAFEIETIDHSDEQVLVPKSHAGLTQSIVRKAKKAVRHWGVTTIDDVTALVNEQFSFSADETFVVRVLESRYDFQWLDRDGGWFWLTSPKSSRLSNRLLKVLSVAKRVHISELRACIRKDIQMEGFAPSQHLLLELCRQLPEYTVESEYITVKQALRWEDILDENEMIMVLVLEEEGPVLQRDDFEEFCLSLGMNHNTFRRYLSHSPVVIRLGYMVYALPGASVDAATVASFIPERKASRVLEDYGWTGDGRIWLGFKISHAMVRDGWFTVPAAMKRFLFGEFDLKTVDGVKIGSVTIQEGGAWGLRPFFRRRGGEPNDFLILYFDSSKREIVADIGDESLLEDLQDV